jgi:hypothetical protein
MDFRVKDCQSSEAPAGHKGSLLSPMQLLPFESVQADVLFSLKTNDPMEPCYLKLHYQ